MSTGMSADETICHINTAEDAHARAQELLGQGVAIELQNLAIVIGGLPPDTVACAHPKNFEVGRELPNPDGSFMLKIQNGIYTSGALTETAKYEYVKYNPNSPDLGLPLATTVEKQDQGLKGQFMSATIASLITEPEPPAPQPDTKGVDAEFVVNPYVRTL